ncbi:MAG: DUF3467 domain-containing protein [Planctomycetota bacterium]
MVFGEDDAANRPPGPPPGSHPAPHGPQQIRLDTTGMETVYANFFALAGSPEEFVIYFGTNSPLPNVSQPAIRLSHRLMLLPSNAKRLLIALQQAVKSHEDRFGPIELPPQQRPPETRG